MIVAILNFIGVLAIILGAYWMFVLRPEATAQRALDKRMMPEALVRRSRLTVPNVEPKGATLFGTIQATIERSGLRLTLPALLVMCWTSGFIVGSMVWKSTDHVLLAIVTGAGASLGPYLWVRRAAAKRMWKFEEQFPEAIDLIARALRAGHAFSTALSMVVDEVPSPVGPEFKLLYDRQSFGMPLPDALRAFVERVPSIDTRFFVTAVLTQREAGGNLSAVLDNLAAVIRDRFNIKRQARVISAHGRITASLLMALPPFVALVQAFIAPRNLAVLFHDPIGLKLLGGAVILQAIGMLAIHKMVKVEY